MIKVIKKEKKENIPDVNRVTVWILSVSESIIVGWFEWDLTWEIDIKKTEIVKGGNLLAYQK